MYMNNQSLSNRRLIATALIATTGMLTASASFAHHSPAKYDIGHPVTIVGTVTKYEWANPHVYIYVEQTTDAGKKIEWEIESFSPSAMRQAGWSLETLHVGDILTINGGAARDPKDKSMIGMSIKRADKTLIDMMKALQKPVGADDAPKFVAKDLGGVWMTQFVMQLLYQNVAPDVSKLTDEGAKAFKNFDDKTMNPGRNCIAFPAPVSMITADLKRIVISRSTIEIENDTDSARRTVHMDVATHAGATPTNQGHSIGKWEGKSLLIDTTNFAYHGIGHGYGVPSGSQKHMIERLTLNADGTSLTYHFEVTDPEYLNQPRTGDVQWTYRPDQKFAPDKCDLDNARRYIKN
jgi:hypothetical protein